MVGPSKFGEFLRRHRLAAGLTQEELAARAVISRRGVQDLERGVRRRPQPGTARRLADALRLDSAARTELLSAVQPSVTRAEELAPSTRPVKLPVPLTSFVGREQETNNFQARLGAARLLTLVGPGGIGKTRLALQVASDLADAHPNWVVWADLAALSTPALVGPAVARALGLRMEPDGHPPEAIFSFVSDRQLLLVLDNCEHLLEACAELVVPLLQRNRGVTILATSREPLGVEGEILWRLGPLDEAAAVRLFVERARALIGEFDGNDTTVIRQVCRALDHLPLAIELAAARAGLLTPAEILARLEDRFALLTRIGSRGGSPRQQTLRATVDWSYELLEKIEQQLFRRLAVFAGAFDLAGAEAVGGVGSLNVLGRLVDKSLVMAQPGDRETRYRLLDTLRSYAWERLVTAGEVQLARRCHLKHFLARAEALFSPTETPDGPTRALDHDLDDLRGALEWCLVDDPQAGLRLVAATQNVWWRRSCAEGRRWAHVFLKRCPEPSLARAKALHTAGRLEVYADAALGRRLLAEGRALAARLGDRATTGMLDAHLGMAALAEGDKAAGIEYFGKGLKAMEDLGDVHASARMLSYLAWITLSDSTRREEARAQLQRAHRVGRELGDRWITSIAEFGFGLYWRRIGQPRRALDYFLRAVVALHGLEELPMLCEALLQVARLVAPIEPVRAARLASASAALAERAGVHFRARSRQRIDELRTDVCARLGLVETHCAWAEGERMSIDEAVALALYQEERAIGRPGDLSPRELEIAQLVASGLSSRRIAETLHLSARTVDSHLGRIFNKLGLSNRLQLTTWLMRTSTQPRGSVASPSRPGDGAQIA